MSTRARPANLLEHSLLAFVGVHGRDSFLFLLRTVRLRELRESPPMQFVVANRILHHVIDAYVYFIRIDTHHAAPDPYAILHVVRSRERCDQTTFHATHNAAWLVLSIGHISHF